MAQYSDDLDSLTGAVRAHKPNASPSQIRTWLNWRMRSIMDRRPYWAGLISKANLYFPQAITGDSVTMTNGSSTVTGSGTTWPVSDKFSALFQSGVGQTGIVNVQISSTVGLSSGDLLYVDDSGDPEIVPVIRVVDDSRITARFRKRHVENATATMSSYVNRQLRVSNRVPTFTIKAVTSPTSLIVDMPWGALTASSLSCTIIQAHFSLGPDVKQLMAVLDPFTGRPLDISHTVIELNIADPLRMAKDAPQWVVDLGPDDAGIMWWEMWPPTTQPKQFPCWYYKQWSDMKNHNDTPPHFINPATIAAGAIADALRTKMPMEDPNSPDPFYDPRSADIWERRFEQGVVEAITADNALVQQQYTWSHSGLKFTSASYWQSHDPDVDAWNV